MTKIKTNPVHKLVVLLFGLIVFSGCKNSASNKGQSQLSSNLHHKSQLIIEQDGQAFRDLNKNKQMDIYEDIRESIDDRIDDLLGQMTLEEKAGMMFINGVPVSTDALPDGKQGLKGFVATQPPITENMDSKKMTHFNTWDIPEDLSILAKWYNNVQQLAENSRLGIPITMASDPRHHFDKNRAEETSSGFTQFCEMPGFAAIGDEGLVREFADIVRKEFLAVGFRESLSPQIDLATEPRWARINGGFSEDASLTARLTKPYIQGLQGKTLSNGVACMTKHFPGGGPQKEGLDPDFIFHKGQIYPGDNFDYHLIPFETAFESNTAGVMPYYGVPTDQTDENVAMAFNKTIITKLLREKYNYDGVVCTNWGLITDIPMGPDVTWEARAWGVEHLSEAERVLKVIEVGCDQFGGESRPELVVQLVNEGKLQEERLNISVRRLLRQKFELGLFDNPFLDETKVTEVIGNESSKALGEKTQRISMTLLKNQNETLPLAQAKHKVFIQNMDSITVSKYAEVVASPEDADFAIIRLNTPWYPVDTKNFIAASFHHGDLDFKGEEKQEVLTLMKKVPTIVDIYLDRPAVIPEITKLAKAVIADFGASDESACEVLFGNAKPQGKLPFELPSSMEAVRSQKADVPYDSQNPLFEFGFGLQYK
ncbi:glycoside hydrolase family 3 protein [Flagellimonas flava]|uniref:beta-glucosidase n=1 Tax=Flagellimonas flava TaxID=570519 RepID=A0A1M5HKC2_9FLAO|nr:glycoside hydrolase family 3 N-terminal domain-containing protein [Allomuricauda flava]SHG16409.1 beta-glucosidase [Allomuricauda flava]